MNKVNKELLRITTVGSVDDGKSTLMGRLLYDSKSIFEDQINSVKKVSINKGFENIDLTLFTDGLKEERERGITIGVAYRYFITSKRKFIITDTPGHIEYTRNMVTGASTANTAILLIDIKKGVVEQTKRHSYILSLLQVNHIIVCVNKMDLVDYNEEEFKKIVSQYKEFSSKAEIKNIRFIPISALVGDNVVIRSSQMPWYQDASLLGILDTIDMSYDMNIVDARFPVQTVLKHPSNSQKYYAGCVAGGFFRIGDKVKILPSGLNSQIKHIYKFENKTTEIFDQMSAAIILEDDVDIYRGDMIVKSNNNPSLSKDLTAMLCWFDNISLKQQTKYIIKHTTNEQEVVIESIVYKININTLKRLENDQEIKMNDICKVKLKTVFPLIIDKYNVNKKTGSFILIDMTTNHTIAAGIIL